MINPSQIDSDHDGIGDCCDGTCILDPLSTGCDECALPAGPGPSSDALTSASFRLKAGSAGNEDKAGFKLAFALPPGAEIAPDAETVTLAISQPGHGGFSASLAAKMVDLLRPAPSYRYIDKTASEHGVAKAQLKGSPDDLETARPCACGHRHRAGDGDAHDR